ncbi:helix-turn-helix transcriptional regulator [Dongia rigui]|uniref:AraC family transcriptional regulator n=1 Tax=Dongia rigui TaxID=940149 RepID=A0ABU5DXP1_9PROT|nr:AraC family transcriptional regulator [Dongia rigui]MDY0872091.1 AraC family transcriptional regulator [Dongia rigui]
MSEPIAPAQEILGAHRVFDVARIDALEATLNPLNGAKLLNVGSAGHDFHAFGNHYFLPLSELWFSWSNTQVTMRYPEDGMLRLRLWHGGKGATCRGRETHLVTADKAVLSTAASDVDFAAGFGQICWRVHRERMERKLAILTDRSLSALNIDATLDLTAPQSAMAMQILGCMTRWIDNAGTNQQPVFLAELEQAFITSLASVGAVGGTSLLAASAPKAAPFQVRRVEAHIEANWDKPITIEDLVEVSGASARSLFRSFKESRGCTPMEFARRLRLQQARQMLEHPQPATTVSEVAFSCGFGDLGRFAKDFHRAFGLRPSELLARHRVLAVVA